jgi:hypothetical protein
VPKGIATVSVLLLAVMLLGCGPSKKQQAIHKQEAGVAEMKRVRAAFGDLQIALNAGVSVQEFSQRTNDTLVKIGDLQHSEVLAENGFPSAKDKVAEIYAHFNNASDFYILSKPLLGPNLDEDDAILEDMMRDSEWKLIQDRFPARVESGYFTFSSRKKNALGLWGLAEENTKAAGDLMDQLSAPTT